MGQYLGKVRIKNDYINFKFYYEFKEGKFLPLPEESVDSFLPDNTRGEIVFFTQWNNSPERQRYHNDELLIINLTEDDEYIEPVRKGKNEAVKYQVNWAKIPNGTIQRMVDCGYYYLLEGSQVEEDINKESILLIDDPHVFQGMDVVIRIDDEPHTVLGPFTVEIRDKGDNALYVNTEKARNKYVISALKFRNLDLPSHIVNFDFSEQIQFESSGWTYVQIDNSFCKEIKYDAITKETLLEDFQNALAAKYPASTIQSSDVNKVVQFYDNELLVGAFPETIRTHRKQMLEQILQSAFHDGDEMRQIMAPISEMIKEYLLNDDEVFSEVAAKLAESPQFMNQIQRNAIIASKIKEHEDTLDSLDQEIEDTARHLENLRNEQARREEELANQKFEKVLGEYNEELANKNSELERIKQQIEDKQLEYNDLEGSLREANEDISNFEELKSKIAFQEEYERKLDRQIDQLKRDLDEYFDDKTKKALHFAFDGMLSNKMLEQASEWESKQKQTDYSRALSSIKSVQPANLSKNELKDYLCSQVQKYRPNYSNNFILNLAVCFTQGFITVFSGEPGTGKTSICDIWSHILGQKIGQEMEVKGNENISLGRYLKVPVEKGWTSKRDLIGYYNPLTKQFDKNNRKLFDSLNILDKERNDPGTSRPFTVLLDEANLSPMEHYWSDFIDVCDNTNNGPQISLGEDYTFYIPEFFRFLATINNDHTTEILSPRVVDRAWVICLPAAKRGTAKTLDLSDDGIMPISWTSLYSAFTPSPDARNDMQTLAATIYQKICDHMENKMNVTFSSRSDAAIRSYMTVAQQEFFSEDDLDKSIIALDYALAQRLLPKISGYGEEYKTQIENLQALCNSSNLRVCNEILEGILRKGEKSMGYFQYFA